VGVSQYHVAALLGLARTQTNLWARGKKPIPDTHLSMLLTLVGQAADAALDALDAHPESLAEAFTGARAQTKAAITSLCEDLRMELLEDVGAGPSAMVAGSLDSLSKYVGMRPEDLRKGDTPAEVVQEATRLLEAAKLLQRLEPLQRILDRESSTSTQES
jgi:DNA-binding transcriptional regulator YdaS (Cro superfamily)